LGSGSVGINGSLCYARAAHYAPCRTAATVPLPCTAHYHALQKRAGGVSCLRTPVARATTHTIRAHAFATAAFCRCFVAFTRCACTPPLFAFLPLRLLRACHGFTFTGGCHRRGSVPPVRTARAFSPATGCRLYSPRGRGRLVGRGRWRRVVQRNDCSWLASTLHSSTTPAQRLLRAPFILPPRLI